MIVFKAVVLVAFLMAVLDAVPAKPQPSIIRERHIIHAPIKFRVIHHYKIKKVPIVIKKHLHYHQKSLTKTTEPLLEEIHFNHIHQDESSAHLQDRNKEFPPLSSSHHRQHTYPIPPAPPQQNHPLSQEEEEEEEEDYEDPRQSQEDYDDYE